MAKLTVLEVGHGSCAVLEDEKVIIIDLPRRWSVPEFLVHRRIRDIHAVMLSHADDDHIGGLANLITAGEFRVGTVYINPDGEKVGPRWDDLRAAVATARREYGTRVVTAFTTDAPESMVCGETTIRVLAPAPELAIGGPGSSYRGSRPSRNTCSGVVLVESAGVGQVLLTGDLDEKGLTYLLEQHARPKSRVLIFPHHGGNARTQDPYTFASRLCELVEPELVIISNGRNRFDTPLFEIVRGIQDGFPAAHVACTQLSRHCAEALNAPIPATVGGRADYAAGGRSHASCAGPVEIELPLGTTDTGPNWRPGRAAHERFIRTYAKDNHLCTLV